MSSRGANGIVDANRRACVVLVLVALFAVLGSACSKSSSNKDSSVESGKLSVVATTTIIADLARNVAGDRADVRSLQPANADAHSFEPTPQDVARVADAALVLEHGLGLDSWISDIAKKSGTDAEMVTVTEGVVPIEHDEDSEQVDHDSHDHTGDDPHVWQDVANAKTMVADIRDALIKVDPDGRDSYNRNAAAYDAQLDELNIWIHDQIATIPEENRKLVTNHDAFGYYVRAYGLELVGSIIPSLDTQAQPSAKETAALIDRIKAEHVKAIFTEASLSPNLARRIAEDAGVAVVDNLYGDSLGPSDSGADTYIGMMRTDTTMIVEALR